MPASPADGGRAADGGGPAAGGRLPALSVVIPARNEEATLPATLDSVLAQEYPGPFEVIVADGSDTAATAELLRRRYPSVLVAPNPRRNTPAGLNAAVAAASGSVIVRCDAHSVLPPGYLRRAAETLERTGAANVGGLQLPVGASFFGRAAALAMASPLGSGGARYRAGGAAGPTDTVFLGAFRRDALEAVGGFDEGLIRNQDYELNWRLRRRGGTVWFDPALAVRYRPRDGLLALARQYFGYGRWKAAVLLRHPASLRPRHLAAPLLVAGLAVSAALALAGAPAPLAAALPLLYALALAGAALAAGARRRDPAAALLPVALAAMHLSWGAGFFVPARPRTASPPAPPTEA